MAKVDAVVLGGGKITDPAFRAAVSVDCKSLIPINGKPMIQWVVETIKASHSVGSVVVVGPQDLLETEVAEIADALLLEENHEVDNLLKGMRALPDSERILMVSGDMPLLTPESIDDLAENTPDADVVYPAVEKSDIMAGFPDREWVFVSMREGQFTGSSAVLFRPKVFIDHEDTLRKVFDARRSVAALVSICGVGIALKYALGQLSLKDIEDRLSQMLCIDGRSYVSRYPEIAFDVDKPSDIAIAEEKLRSRALP